MADRCKSVSITELDQIRPRQCRRCLVLYPGLVPTNNGNGYRPVVRLEEGK
jgi:hypothetical protein